MRPVCDAKRMHCSYYGAMPSVTIRDVPDDARNTLAARAARNGQSLQEYLRGALIELADKPDLAELMADVRQRKAVVGTEVSADQILADLHADRR